MDGAGAPKLVSRWGLLRMAFGLTAAELCSERWWTSAGRELLGATRASSSAKNNQLRTGADKGNPTV